MGLKNMNNRAKMIGAHFSISGQPGGGTKATIYLPFKEQNG
jgi:signal transduction histidine kinase